MLEERKVEVEEKTASESGLPEENGESPEQFPATEEVVVAEEATQSEAVEEREGEVTVDQALIERFERELAEAKRQADEYYDKYLRALAELDNTRKRLERTYQERLIQAQRDLLRRFLTVADNLERALEAAKTGGDIVQGVELTYRELQRFLSEQGVEPIESVGHPFDPMFHEAVGVVSSDGVEEETVVNELQRGYTHQGELLRPALVEVAKPPETLAEQPSETPNTNVRDEAGRDVRGCYTDYGDFHAKPSKR